MSDVRHELEEAEARVARLKRIIQTGPCRETGHNFQLHGHRCCGCEEESCSIPVNVCTKCGDYDYGENPEAVTIRRECEERNS